MKRHQPGGKLVPRRKNVLCSDRRVFAVDLSASDLSAVIRF